MCLNVLCGGSKKKERKRKPTTEKFIINVLGWKCDDGKIELDEQEMKMRRNHRNENLQKKAKK